MNICSEISIYETNSSHSFFKEVEINFEIISVVYILCILISFPANSYVIWLIVTGTGNGLVAEFFVLNLSVCEMILCVQNLLILLCSKFQNSVIVLAILDGVIIIGHPSFECLMCVERYLAVVHPVTFLKYKPLRYRLMCAAGAWVAACASAGFSTAIWLFSFSLYLIVCLVPFFVFISIQLYCCLAVLRALKQSGPGERGREREREREENHMKRRAFHLILITTVATVIIYAGYFIVFFLPTTENRGEISLCIGQFCYVLTGLVQPVLFLYRVGKLSFRSQ